MANLSPIPSAAMRYLSASFFQLANLPHYGYKITVNDQIITKPLELLAICNTSYYGNGIKICAEADPTDGFFDIMYSSGISALRAIYIFAKAMIGIRISPKAVTRIKAKKIIIEPSDDDQTPPVIQADGEAVGQTPLEIKIIPKALDIIMPPKVLQTINDNKLD
jgi:diacylglycerol kinase (ATP)